MMLLLSSEQVKTANRTLTQTTQHYQSQLHRLRCVSPARGRPCPGRAPCGGRTCPATRHLIENVRKSKSVTSVRKPVIVRKFSRDWYAGYASANFGQDAAELEILDQTGKVLHIGWEQVKWVCYVRDFPSQTADQANPERLMHKRFSVRPRIAGLWLRMTLKDGDELEGLAGNDLSLVEGAGLLLTPPDTRSSTQRIYVPRQAIQSLEVVSLIGAPGRRHAQAAAREKELDLFPGELEN